MTGFHQGELEVQQLVGVQAIASKVGHLIEKSVPLRALDFIRQQAMIWIGVEDCEGLPWAFPLFGLPGFINPNQGESIEIELNGKFPIPEQWLMHLQTGKAIGCLVIELSTRRRLRINGVISDINARRLQVDVQQAYPNCPKYIRQREMPEQFDCCKFHFQSSGQVLNRQLENIISQSDTAFVASLGPNGADVSHRGGPSGFIRCQSPRTVIVPDYQGNSMFNTLGNFKAYPFGGLIVVDFNQGYFLQLSGDIKLSFEQEKLQTTIDGTDRLWELTINQWQLFQLANNIQWESLDFSAHNP